VTLLPIFHVKIQIFVTSKSDQDPDRIRVEIKSWVNNTDQYPRFRIDSEFLGI
jgi:hypothetical protein